MDDLLKIAGGIMDKFDPATDSASDFESLPDGDYTGLIEEVNNSRNEKGTTWISMKVEVTDGDSKGRVIFVNYYFTEKMAERAIKEILIVVNQLGFENLPLDAFKSMDSLAEALQALVGSDVSVNQKTSKNGFTNQTVSAIA
jgi:hypothetical protein